MKRIKILSFVLPLLALLFSACTLETDNDAGRMEGMWHLVKIESMTSAANEDLSEQVIFWSFQAKLLQMRIRQDSIIAISIASGLIMTN